MRAHECQMRIRIGAFIFSALILVLGYISFGFWTMMIFTSGFIGGYLLWLLIPTQISYSNIKVPFWITFILFAVHRVEEKISGFFSTLSEITKVPTPEIASWNVVLLVILSAGGWLLIPWLVKRKHEFGYYLLWTFFAAMGITELAHILVFPFLVERPYGYFPGMISVFFLAPTAWWGTYRLILNRRMKY